MKFRTRWMMVPALLLSTLAGCDFGNEDSFQRQNLAQARTKWDSRDVASYSYVLELQCFCAPASELRPVLVTVTNGAVVSLQYWAVNPTGRTPAPASIFGAYDSVEKLFELVADAIDRDADVLQVGYDPEYGFPTAVNVDYEPGGSEQLLFFVTRFTPAAMP